jgi:hypothetical protein
MDWANCKNGQRKDGEKIRERRPTAVRGLRFRWEGYVSADVGKIKTQNWSKMAMDREKWKTIVEQVKTHEEM